MVSLATAALIACSSEPNETAPFEKLAPVSPTAQRVAPERSDGHQDATLGHAVRLGVGESAFYKNEGLEMRFVSVVEDSRCPASAQCIQAGQAKVSIQIKAISGDHALLSLEVGDSGGLRRNNVFGLHILTLLDLEPYPDLATEDPEYKATLLLGR